MPLGRAKQYEKSQLNGDLRIDGTLKGNVHTKGLLVLGETGIIEGEVVVKNALIAGTVKAKFKSLNYYA